MQLEQSFEVPVPVAQAWTVLLDVERIAPCMPGATLTGFDGTEFTGLVKVKLGPISLSYRGSGRFAERDEEGRRVVLVASGQDSRGAGGAQARVTAVLHPANGGSATLVKVVANLDIAGKAAQFGRGLIADVTGRLVKQFADCLAQKIASEPVPAARVERVAERVAEAPAYVPPPLAPVFEEPPAYIPPAVPEPVVEAPVFVPPPLSPVFEEPVAYVPPVVEEPVAYVPPVVEEPVAEEPAFEYPVAQESVVEEPLVAEPVAEAPVAYVPPVVEEPAFEYPVAEPAMEPVAQPSTEDPWPGGAAAESEPQGEPEPQPEPELVKQSATAPVSVGEKPAPVENEAIDLLAVSGARRRMLPVLIVVGLVVAAVIVWLAIG